MPIVPTSERQTSSPVPAHAQADLERARTYAAQAIAANTKRSYRADWSDFQRWCDERGHVAFPATTETVTLYIAARADAGPPDATGQPTPGLKTSTLARRLAAINHIHRRAAYAPPASRRDEPLHSVWRGIVRAKGSAPKKAAPALPDDLRAVLAALPRTDDGHLTFTSMRNRALLLLGFAGALRRSELVAIERAHVQFTPTGLRLFIPRAKADQDGEGAVLGIHHGRDPLTCPVRCLRAYLFGADEHLGTPLSGPLFRKIDRWGRLWPTGLHPGTVLDIVKATFAAAGLDPAPYAGHSLRSGFITQAARQGKHERDIMRHSRHKDVLTLREYIHEGTLFEDNPTDGIGL